MKSFIYNTINTTVLDLDRLLGSFAPHVCLMCGDEGGVLCERCSLLAGEPIAPRCAGCKKLSKDYRTCTSCRAWLVARQIRVATNYDGVYERLLHAYKFQFQRQAATPIVKIMLQTAIPREIDCVVPLPTAPNRVRMRGFDHARLLAKKYAAEARLPVQHSLKRITHTRQVGASRSKRIQQMENAFQFVKRRSVTGKRVLLIDDVMTTGASVAAAARLLKKAGAKEVSVVVFAQKV